MGDVMRPVALPQLVARIFAEYKAARSIFAYPSCHFFHKKGRQNFSLDGEEIATAVGPAAGPHTQLAQNIVTAYLAGARFLELKTVQEHEPSVAKPCIDADDEGFNTEWSSEFTVEKAYQEYIKAWVLLHLLEEVFALSQSGKRSFVFNMSAGYDLAGIQSPRMDAYLHNLLDASVHPYFQQCLAELETVITADGFLRGTGLEKCLPQLQGLSKRISGKICQSITLSTMHGCPPAEIEKICCYLLTEKKINVYVKLNPTLLGYQGVRSLLANTGFNYIELAEAAFAHDLQYADAIPMLKRLKKLAAAEGRFFGVKLTNTLGTVNFKGKLPGEEMYMSGRALFLLAITLAAKISTEFKGQMPISFSGGLSEHNLLAVFATGIKPLTMATELLKPGGYSRLAAIASKMEAALGWEAGQIDVAKLQALAAKTMTAAYVQKHFRGNNKAVLKSKLPLFDCAAAPCKSACPISQDIPAYIRLAGEKHYAEALALIYAQNALPGITGAICTHICQDNCTRLDYEGCVEIREVKRLAVEQGWDEYQKNYVLPQQKVSVKVAVMGAGPAGLATAFFLTRQGISVTVYETRASAGGTVAHIIPNFRISSETITSDIDFIKAHGVKFVFNCSLELTPAKLQAQNYKYVVVAVGAAAEKTLPFKQAGTKQPQIITALQFLAKFNKVVTTLALGKKVLTIGAGNTAMDVSRAVLRLKGVTESGIVYRRSQAEMPAASKEYDLALAEKVHFNFLLNPERIDANGALVCQVMQLGRADSSGRRQPEATGEYKTLLADTIIIAIGEESDKALLQQLGITTKGQLETNLENVYLAGDARQGGSSIVKCIADGRSVADAICQRELSDFKTEAGGNTTATDAQAREIIGKKFGLTAAAVLAGEGAGKVAVAIGAKEHSRCLECNYICNKCVEVCPNRANLAIHFTAGFSNYNQIVHLDAFCNECGNCAGFCPWEGRPFAEKVTVFSRLDDFEQSQNSGFLLAGETIVVRASGKVSSHKLIKGQLEPGKEGLPGNDKTDFGQIAGIFNYLYANRPELFGPVEE